MHFLRFYCQFYKLKVKSNQSKYNKKSSPFVRDIPNAPHVYLIYEPLYHFIWKFLSLDIDITLISVVYGFGLILVDEHENDANLFAWAKGYKEEELFAQFSKGRVLFFEFLLDLVLLAVFVSFGLFGLDGFGWLFGKLFFYRCGCWQFLIIGDAWVMKKVL